MSKLLDRRTVLAALAAAPVLAHSSPGGANQPVANSLKVAAAGAGRYYGAAVQLGQLENDAAFRDAVLQNCAYITPEFQMKWDVLEPSRGRRSFGEVDRLCAFAVQHGLRVRGHALLWELSTPGWAKAAIVERRDWRPVAEFFAAVLPRYSATVEDWDVINEPIDTTAHGGLKRNSFLKAFGPDYIQRALEQAREAAPNANLAINDYGFDYDTPYETERRRRLLALLETLKTSGAPIDQVGIQAHLDLSQGPVNQKVFGRFLQDIADMGLQIVITELDVRESNFDAPLAVRDAKVADEVTRYLDVALAQPAVKGVITWGLTDRHSWIQPAGVRRGVVNRGLPFDTAFQAKPMYAALRRSFANRAQLASL